MAVLVVKIRFLRQWRVGKFISTYRDSSRESLRASVDARKN